MLNPRNYPESRAAQDMTPIVGIKVKTATINASPQAANTTLEHTVTIPGVKFGDYLLGIEVAQMGANMAAGGAYISADNTVKVRLVNPTTGFVSPGTVDLKVIYAKAAI